MVSIQGFFGEYFPGGDACPEGLEGIIEACPGGIYKSVPGGWRYNNNINLSRGGFIYCPGGRGYVCHP